MDIMVRRIRLCLVLAFGLLVLITAAGAQQPSIKATILYDNYGFREGCRTDWGFSCLIEGMEKTILFDAGAAGDVLLQNADRVGVDLRKVDIVVISHTHDDHTGGLAAALGRIGKVSVYLPYSSPPALEKSLAGAGAQVIRRREPSAIASDAMLTGEMGIQIKEQALVLKTTRGLVVVTGCSHPGIVSMLERAREVGNADLHLVLGGFHLMEHSPADVRSIIARFRDLGVRNLGATHCTGDEAIALFGQAYGRHFIKMGVGRIVDLLEPEGAAPPEGIS